MKGTYLLFTYLHRERGIVYTVYTNTYLLYILTMYTLLLLLLYTFDLYPLLLLSDTY